jgi:putative zinc finger protein
MSCQLREYVAAYVLDALEPDEAAMVHEHLDSCAACQDELAAVVWIPPLLPLVDAAEVERLDGTSEEPPPRLLERLIAEIAREARTPRGRRATAMIGAAALLVAVGGLSTAAGLSSGHHRTSTVNAVDPRTHVHATATVSGRSWGTQLGLTLSGAYPNGTCSLIARSDDGRSDTAATWVASPQGSASVPGATSIPAGHLSELDIVTAKGYQLVRIVVHH